MPKLFLKYFILATVLNTTLLGKVFADEILFPENVYVEYNNQKVELFRTGQTVRKKLFLQVYSIAHYFELKPEVANENIYQHILQDDGIKQVSMVFLRALSAERIKKSLLTSMKLNSSEEEYKQMSLEIDKFMRAITDDVEKQDNFILRWFPDGTTVSIFQGREISSINSELFAKTLWSIWFGEHAVVDKRELVQQMLTSS